MSLAPYTAWIIAQKNRDGQLSGVENTLNGKFFCDQKEAESTLGSVPPIMGSGFMVAEIVMVGAAEFQRDYNPLTEEKILNAAKVAYEKADDSAAKRVPWHNLADHWKTYWINLASAMDGKNNAQGTEIA